MGSLLKKIPAAAALRLYKKNLKKQFPNQKREKTARK